VNIGAVPQRSNDLDDLGRVFARLSLCSAN
jgi:hypothetical protein